MGLKKSITAASIALGIAVAAAPFVKEKIDKVRGDITHALNPDGERAVQAKEITELLKPTDLVYNRSLSYIRGLRGIRLTPEEIRDVVDTHARLSMVAEVTESGQLSLQQILFLLQGSEAIITTPGVTKLTIAADFGNINLLNRLRDGTLVLSGGPQGNDTHLSNCTFTAEMHGGELIINISGNKSIGKASGPRKHYVTAPTGEVPTGGIETLTIKVGAVHR